MVLPNKVKRTSPGNLPTPNFSSHGSTEENTITAIKMVITQRIMRCFHNGAASAIQGAACGRFGYSLWLRSLRWNFSGSCTFLPTTSTLNNSPISACEVSFCTALA